MAVEGDWLFNEFVLWLTLWCLHLNVVGEFASFRDPESYAGGSVATGRVSQAGQVKG
jgi:hypothetical protein